MAHDAPAAAPSPDTLVRDIVIVVGFLSLVYVSTNITPITFDSVSSGEAPAVVLSYFISKIATNASLATIKDFIFSLQNVLAFLGLLFLAGSFWATLRINEIHHHEEEKNKPIKNEETASSEKLISWQVIVNHMNSENPAEWKLAILEADNILDEVLEDMGYSGETVAEKLKGMSRTKIASYDGIWEAHKLRNQIAHGETLDVELSPKVARDAIAKFENAFKELGYL